MPQPVSVDLRLVQEAAQQAVALNANLDAIREHIREHSIDDLWMDTIVGLRKEEGVPKMFSFYDAPYLLSGVDYEMSIEPDGALYFSGYDRERDFHGYTIPAKFLFEETRDEVIEALRAEYAAECDVLTREAQSKAEKVRERDEAEFERLGRSLGKF